MSQEDRLQTLIATLRALASIHVQYDPNPGNPVQPYLCRECEKLWPCLTAQTVANGLREGQAHE